MLLSDYMTTREAAGVLDMKQSAVTRAIQRGRLFRGAIKVGRDHLIPKTDVERVRVLRLTLRELQGEQVSA